MVVGEVLVLVVFGRRALIILAWSLGSPLAFFSADCIFSRFSCRICFRSLFLYCLCWSMFLWVGFWIRLWYRVCCFFICLRSRGVIQLFRRGRGVRSCRSICCRIVVCSWSSIWDGFWLCWFGSVVMARWMSARICCLWRVYLPVERVGVEVVFLWAGVWKIV